MMYVGVQLSEFGDCSVLLYVMYVYCVGLYILVGFLIARGDRDVRKAMNTNEYRNFER